MPRIEIYGTEGTLSLPDPNTFGGPVKTAKAGEKEWADVPLTHGYADQSRGLGVADMADSLTTAANARIAPAAHLPITCSTSCTPFTMRRWQTGTLKWRAA